ncbi:hypothetical protein SLS62_001944 [Diatrype stigma]|uniref:Uncharacterized protein n=1 Tax=Diatrype stigma TaxID=117547 RepID=A0AAN9UYN8_9PEZI
MSGFELLGAFAAAGQIQDTPNEIQNLLGEIDTLCNLSKDIQSTPALQTQEIAKVLQRCLLYIDKLKIVLEKIQFDEADSELKKVRKAVEGLIHDKEIVDLFGNLDREKSSLQLNIDVINS